MRLPGFVGPTYTLRDVSIDAQRCVNLFLEINELGTAANGERGALVSAPGKTKLATIGTGPIRGQIFTSTGRLVVVSGSEVYRVDYPGWVPVLVGSLLSSVGPVGMADNSLQILIVDGPNGYIVSLSTGDLTVIPGFPGGDTCAFVDDYFVVNIPGTSQFARSNGFDGFTWDPDNDNAAIGNPDALVAVVMDRRQIWLMGARSIEVWFNSGADTTFSRIDGGYMEYGCKAKASAIRFANTVAWLGDGPNASGVVWMAEGYTPKRISNHAVEFAIQGYANPEQATAYTYQQDGHVFYVLNFPSADRSWVFDIATGQWHERAYLGIDGKFQRDRGDNYCFAYDTNVVGDYQNGNIYQLSTSVYTDNGNSLVRMRRGIFASNNLKRMIVSFFQLDARIGVGLDGAPPVGLDPQVMLRYSDDGGNTWSTEQTRSLGKIGEYLTRVIWRRLGMTRKRVFEVKVSDPVSVTILGAEVEINAGAS